MTAGQYRVLVLLLLLLGMEAIANPTILGGFKGLAGGFWNLGGK